MTHICHIVLMDNANQEKTLLAVKNPCAELLNPEHQLADPLVQ